MLQNLTLIRSVLRNIKKKFLVSCVILAFIQVGAFAQPTTTISISPVSETAGLNQTFVTAIHVDIATSGTFTSITGVQLGLDFDRTKLEVLSIAKPASALFTLEITPLATIASINSTGQITYQAGIPTGNTSIDFNILEVTFRTRPAAAPGSTPLTLTNTPPRLTRAINGGNPVSGPSTSGSVSIITCTPPTATIANTLTCNGQAFSLNLNAATGVSPYDLVINGQTYNDVTVGSTITTFTPPTVNIFTNPNPASADETDAAVTLGLKFQSNVPGFVKGVRFFSHGTPSGTYRGQLWTSTGTLIASGTFSSVAGDSWNQLLFTSPVLIPANTTYIVSYHTTTGRYTATANGLASPVTNGSLTALASGSPSGPNGNGMYIYGPTPTLPNNSFGNANYWVDVVFTPASYTFNVTSITDGSGCTVTGSPVLSLGVLSADCSTLPVTLLNLSATPANKDIVLRWSTASEIDNKGFEIQRSTPGSAWEGIGYVRGAGNSNSLLNYSYADKDLFPRTYNYRLKQEDIDGNYKYSMIVSVRLDGQAEFKLSQNYPNPFRGETTIQYILPAREKVTLTIFDMNGRVVKALINNTSKDAGTHAVNFFTASLPPGIYYYRLQAGSFTETKKMIVQ